MPIIFRLYLRFSIFEVYRIVWVSIDHLMPSLIIQVLCSSWADTRDGGCRNSVNGIWPVHSWGTHSLRPSNNYVRLIKLLLYIIEPHQIIHNAPRAHLSLRPVLSRLLPSSELLCCIWDISTVSIGKHSCIDLSGAPGDLIIQNIYLWLSIGLKHLLGLMESFSSVSIPSQSITGRL